MFKAVFVTLFPEMFPSTLEFSLAGKALKEKKWDYQCVNIRDFGKTKHLNVDDTPYGGGAGMVMKPDVIHDALLKAKEKAPHNRFLFMSPRGVPLTQEKVKEYAELPGLTILCGRFEGVDQRVIDEWELEEVSIGDYILSGGELAALVLLDSCIRLLPDVMGNQESEVAESFSQGLLEYPQYTKPHTWNDKKVPDVLISGDHQKISKWRQLKAEEITQKRRPDLWESYQKKRVGPC